MATAKFVVIARGLVSNVGTKKEPKMAEVDIGEKVTLAVDEYGMPSESAIPFVDVTVAKLKKAKMVEDEEFEDEEDEEFEDEETE